MTWILILEPHRGGWPAIIGGYTDRAVAVAAGEYACADVQTRDMTDEQREQWEDDQMEDSGGWVSNTHWKSWTVIPGDVATATKPDLSPTGVPVVLGPATVSAS